MNTGFEGLLGWSQWSRNLISGSEDLIQLPITFPNVIKCIISQNSHNESSLNMYIQGYVTNDYTLNQVRVKTYVVNGSTGAITHRDWSNASIFVNGW